MLHREDVNFASANRVRNDVLVEHQFAPACESSRPAELWKLRETFAARKEPISNSQRRIRTVGRNIAIDRGDTGERAP
jgi:hypothetical protein